MNFDWQTIRNQCRGLRASQASERVLQAFSVRVFPTPVFQIASLMGVDLKIQACEGMEGGLEWTYPPTMYINALNSEIRQRFTCAHEIGHLILHPEGMNHLDETCPPGPEYRSIEKEANEFAAFLLMPLWALEPAVLRYGKNVEPVLSMFGISASALNWQLDWLK